MEDSSYAFTFLEDSVFSTLVNAETTGSLRKWGLLDSMSLLKFRFDKPFYDMNPGGFIRDLLNSAELSRVFPTVQLCRQSEFLQTVNFQELRTTATSMDFFDFLKEIDLVDARGNIKKVIPDYKDDIELVDKIRKAVLDEESEEYEMLDDLKRNEFLFRVLRHLEIGGGVCQYEDVIDPYLTVVQSLYKDLLTVRKDETGEVHILSKVYELQGNNEFLPFPQEHPQNFFYVIVDPTYRQVVLWYHKWKSFW